MLNYKRYRPAPRIDFPERTWPAKTIEKAPRWCPVDLRDGNQALISPMNIAQKLEFFRLLCRLGFKEIEVAFPAASQTEFDFVRTLIEDKLIPDDVYIQVICQCRPQLIERTFEAIKGAPNVIFNAYNSISNLQRDVVFHKDAGMVRHIAMEAVDLIKTLRWESGIEGNFVLEYSAESFTGSDLKFAHSICESVKEIWQPDPVNNPMIISLPSTVEDHTPAGYADMIEWMGTHLSYRDKFTLCVHPHNDRGTGVAAAEMALMAGAERLEATLFGNGERSGNCDLLTVAYNMFSQGIDPGLNLENEPEIQEIFERCTGMQVSDRHPYAGKLVFTAFSGSHQDAINKGIRKMARDKSDVWAVPYLPIDPADIGRQYEPLVRINSQSGKGGVAFVMDSYYGYKLPKSMHGELAAKVQEASEDGSELKPQDIFDIFEKEYINATHPLEMKTIRILDTAFDHGEMQTLIRLEYFHNGDIYIAKGIGTGPLDAAQAALEDELGIHIRIKDYSEHSLTEGSAAEAVSYIELQDQESGKTAFGVGRSSNTMVAQMRALFSAVNRLQLVR